MTDEEYYPNQTLTLPLKKKWFEMIKSGEKKEEYREVSDYWVRRFIAVTEERYFNKDRTYNLDAIKSEKYHPFKYYSKVEFTLGYPKKDDTSRRLVFGNPKIEIRTGKPEWGAEKDKKYFVITWKK